MYLLHPGTINSALPEGYRYEGHPDEPGIAGRHAQFEISFTRIWVHARSMRYVLYRSSLLYTCDGRIRQQHMTLSRVAISLWQAAEALAFILALSVLLRPRDQGGWGSGRCTPSTS